MACPSKEICKVFSVGKCSWFGRVKKKKFCNQFIDISSGQEVNIIRKTPRYGKEKKKVEEPVVAKEVKQEPVAQGKGVAVNDMLHIIMEPLPNCFVPMKLTMVFKTQRSLEAFMAVCDAGTVHCTDKDATEMALALWEHANNHL